MTEPDSHEGLTIESFPGRDVSLGSLTVTRVLPLRHRRLVGPWCFLDRFGPLSFTDARPMDVAPHPHTGMQTVTWLLDGEVAHDDSLGCDGIVRPGEVNVMTAGRGIAHAEQTPPDHTGRLNGVQLWAALPDADRHAAPSFTHIDRVPVVETPGSLARVFSGTLAGETAPSPHHSALVGADIQVHAHGAFECELSPRFEHAVLVFHGPCEVDRQPLGERQLHYLGPGRSRVTFESTSGCRLLLIGGPPFPEPIVMWWNFVARTPEEIRAARADWEGHRRFGEVRAYRGPRLDAPKL